MDERERAESDFFDVFHVRAAQRREQEATLKQFAWMR